MTNLSDERLLELWRSVRGPHAQLDGPLIRFAGKVFAEVAALQPRSEGTTPAPATLDVGVQAFLTAIVEAHGCNSHHWLTACAKSLLAEARSPGAVPEARPQETTRSRRRIRSGRARPTRPETTGTSGALTANITVTT
jgi:hypothetical protein